MQDVPEHSWGQALTPNGTCASSVHVVTQELGNRWDQAPVPLTCRHRAFLGSPGGQGGAAETTYHSIRTINSIHINLCYKSYKGGCFWVFRSTFYFKAVYSVFINCLEKKKGIAMSGNYKELKTAQLLKPRLFPMQSRCVYGHHTESTCCLLSQSSPSESWLWGNTKRPGTLSWCH